MKSLFQTLIFGLFIFAFTNGKQLPGDADGYQYSISGDVYNKNKTHVMQDNHQQENYGDEEHCPAYEDVAPCVCSYDRHYKALDFHCSHKDINEDQLKQIFKADFPVKKFRELIIEFNNVLKVLESSVFNGVSFEKISFLYARALETIEMNALDSSYETAKEVTFYYNKLTSFPFDELSKFSALTYLDIGSSPLSMVPADAFNGLTTLETLKIYSTTQNIVGNFENIPNLKRIALTSNHLKIIASGFINTGSSHLRSIYLGSNTMVDVEPGAFEIVKGLKVDMFANYLSTLDEAAWRPLLEAGGELDARKNPLSCGCDIAWLFNNPDNLLHQVTKLTTCSNGEYIHDLDSSLFDDC